MATRHQARQAVVSLLYAHEMGSSSDEFIGEFLEEKKIRNERKTQASDTFRQILAKQNEIDEILKSHLKDGDISKVGVVERAILRLAIFEISLGDTDRAVIINEAVELAKELTSDTSPRFINGVLGAIK
ncbi:transcription antitermination factor NusB [Campylobacter gastrosuis]|uniref:Transcription antitermination protein NusB n=1 Tax=Campylobacter gastrosuis TaxID=2974576 RepID=A0ABT7HRM1_9BACT|nr:transcription antitermination factor NusB [Campylobacter gastrosuis]MDL0089063.1 transcription antitermination factor NusB [Campylobacter gastrosuis]